MNRFEVFNEGWRRAAAFAKSADSSAESIRLAEITSRRRFADVPDARLVALGARAVDAVRETCIGQIFEWDARLARKAGATLIGLESVETSPEYHGETIGEGE